MSLLGALAAGHKQMPAIPVLLGRTRPLRSTNLISAVSRASLTNAGVAPGGAKRVFAFDLPYSAPLRVCCRQV